MQNIIHRERERKRGLINGEESLETQKNIQLESYVHGERRDKSTRKKRNGRTKYWEKWESWENAGVGEKKESW